jgi:hypothetical protein
MLEIHNEFNESYRAGLRPFGSVQNEPGKPAIHIRAIHVKNLDLERVLTRKPPTWHYAVQMGRGRKNMAQMARELEPLPSGWSGMSIGDAMHLLHLPETSSVTTSGLRQALEHALEHAKFDEIPVLLGAYRILEGHFGGPEGAATRQDDPTSASWPSVSAQATPGPVALDPWEDDPSITVSDIRMIEPASVAAGSSLQAAPWFQGGRDPQQIVIDDFNLSQPNLLEARASAVRRAPSVVKMQAANSPSISRAWRMSIPGLLAVGFAGLLVAWAYHPTAQGLIASVFGQPQPQAVVSESIPTTQVPQAEAGVQAVPNNPQAAGPEAVETAPSVISNAPVMVRAPEVLTPEVMAPEASTVNAEPNSKPNSIEQALKPSSGKSISSKPAQIKPISSKPAQVKPISSKPTSSIASVQAAKAVASKATKPTVIAARQPNVSKPRTVARLKSNLNKPGASKPQPVLSQTKKVIQVVTNAVTQAPKTTVGKPLRVSSQSSSRTGRTTQSTRVNTSAAAPKRVTPKNVTASSNPPTDNSITNPIKLASNNERDAAAARAIANPQPVSSIQVPKASGKIDNLSREDFGQRYFNRKLYEVWQRDGAKLRYGSWDEVPLELQILENDLFRSAIYLDGPSGNDIKDNEKPVQP